MGLVAIFAVVLIALPLTALGLLWYDWPRHAGFHIVVVALQVPPMISLVVLTYRVLLTDDLSDAAFSAGVWTLIVTGLVGVGSLLLALYNRWPDETSAATTVAGMSYLAGRAIRHEQRRRDKERSEALADELERRRNDL